MLRRKSILAWRLGFAGSVVLLYLIVSRSTGEDSRFEVVRRARRLEAFAGRHHASPIYQAIARCTGGDPSHYLRERARRKAEALYQSGELVCLTVPVRNLWVRLPEIRDRLRTNSTCVLWRASNEDLTLFLRPADVAFWGSDFCEVTNRVPLGDLRKFVGNSEYSEFRLPDGSLVDFYACHKWLNESVTAGWRVGVAIESRRAGDSVFLACRNEPGRNAQRGDARNERP